MFFVYSHFLASSQFMFLVTTCNQVLSVTRNASKAILTENRDEQNDWRCIQPWRKRLVYSITGCDTAWKLLHSVTIVLSYAWHINRLRELLVQSKWRMMSECLCWKVSFVKQLMCLICNLMVSCLNICCLAVFLIAFYSNRFGFLVCNVGKSIQRIFVCFVWTSGFYKSSKCRSFLARSKAMLLILCDLNKL